MWVRRICGGKSLMNGEQLGQVNEFKYLSYLLIKKEINDAECSRNVVNGIKMNDTTKYFYLISLST